MEEASLQMLEDRWVRVDFVKEKRDSRRHEASFLVSPEEDKCPSDLCRTGEGPMRDEEEEVEVFSS